MPAEIHELYISRSSEESRDSQSITLEYFLRDVPEDSNDEDYNARELVSNTVPTSLYGLLLDNIRLTPLGGGCWTASVRYSSLQPTMNPGTGTDPASPPPPSPPPPPPPGPTEYEALPSGFSFSIAGVEEKITQSLATISATKRGGGVAPDTGGAIGVTADGEVEGCTILRPQFEWKVTRTFAYVTKNYIKQVKSLVGKVNALTFYTHPAYSTLCTGVEGDVKNNGPVNMTFTFLTGDNETNIQICDGLIVPVKRAHDYLWVSYSPVSDATVLTMQPTAAYVERVYKPGNFSLFLIGS